MEFNSGFKGLNSVIKHRHYWDVSPKNNNRKS